MTHKIKLEDILDCSLRETISSSAEDGKQLVAVFYPAQKREAYLIWFNLHVEAECEIFFDFREAIDFYNSK